MQKLTLFWCFNVFQVTFEVDAKVTECQNGNGPGKPIKKVVIYPRTKKGDQLVLQLTTLCECSCRTDETKWVYWTTWVFSLATLYVHFVNSFRCVDFCCGSCVELKTKSINISSSGTHISLAVVNSCIWEVYSARYPKDNESH